MFKGKFFWPDGDRYEGEWKEGKRTGLGKKRREIIIMIIILCLINYYFGVK